ncbi:hypothetical protein [Streptomyces sp. NPDC050856]|uniref:hypothetical protein n=1 Tax=Streptomyces sp. NPDC050856 TaxID=3154939 RepID=UPI0033D29177
MSVIVRAAPAVPAGAETTPDGPGGTGPGPGDRADLPHRTWNHPPLDRGPATVVTVDGEVAAFAAALTDGASRCPSGVTGPPRAHRGRGPAEFAEAGPPPRARADGRTEAYTGDAGAGGPVVGEWSGYETRETEVRHVRTLD